ncbi:MULTISPECIES: MmpS family transport accessory protein [unclassified Mycobacterium]|uniref:MmpS family transport accessory protein n=1 Tax=unclassified Mycobacterium TaxID=2642494 RepID=UPI0009EE2400
MADFQLSAKSATRGSIVVHSDSDSRGCRIEVPGVVKTETTSHEAGAVSFSRLTAT